jgi:hypothetical protein
MEHRSDLENILLNGLPEQERHHVVKIMQQVTTGKLQRLRAQDVRDQQPIDLSEADEFEQELS